MVGKTILILDENEASRKFLANLLYRTRSQIALFLKVESAICDRGYYINDISYI